MQEFCTLVYSFEPWYLLIVVVQYASIHQENN